MMKKPTRSFRTVALLFIAGLGTVLSAHSTYSQSLQTEPGIRFEAGVHWTLGIQASEFIRDYQSILGGASSSFGVPIGARGSVSQYISDNITVGLSGGFSRASIRESYLYDPQPPQIRLGPPQYVIQNIEVSAVPAFATLEYFPGKRQFAGYVGLGLGVLLSTIEWTEEIQPTRQVGSRRSGTRLNESYIVPAINLRAGICLGFDGSLGSRSSTGIRIQAGYMIAPISAPFMSGQFASFAVPPPERLQQDYVIDPGGVSLEIGISLLLRQRSR
jgi:hypothetical protein